MNIFDIHTNITDAYEEYIRSFVNISDERIRQEVETTISEPVETPIIIQLPALAPKELPGFYY
jgi:hypothetical protein